MLSRKEAINLARFSETLVCTEVEDISELIRVYAELGHYELDVFIDKSLAKKVKRVLDKNGYYSKVTDYAALEHECSIYISWMSNL